MKYFFLCFVLLIACCAHKDSAVNEQRKTLFKTTFNPEKNFANDLKESSDDQLIMTVVTSKRDDYSPDYSLAIAFRWMPSKNGQSYGEYTARMLRVKPTGELVSSYDIGNFEWVETGLSACEGAITAMDGVRISNWQPDIHFALLNIEDREVIMHPAMIRIEMAGDYTTTTYEGWRLAEGPPAAVRALVATLEPCWKPSKSIPPWEK